jgi:hypothetical protein
LGSGSAAIILSMLANSQKGFTLPRLGWSEVALSLVFAGFMILGFSR